MTKKAMALGALLALVAVAAPAGADLVAEPEGPTVESRRPEPSVDVRLELGARSFRIGGRLLGRDGQVAGAWLGGQTRPDGFSLDGRVERDGRTRGFRFDADIDEWVRRAFRWWSVTDL